MSLRSIVSTLLFGLLPLTVAATPVQAQTGTTCDAQCLEDLAGTFLDNMVDQYPQGVPFADSVRFTENGQDISVSDGIWKNSLGWSYRHTFVDAEQGGIGFFGVLLEKEKTKAIIALRMKVENRQFTEVESLVVHEGEFPLFKTDMTRAREPFYMRVPAENRNTREELKAIATGYFNGLATGNPDGLHFHPDCNRQENGFQTTNNPPLINRSCADLFPFIYMHSFRTPDFPVIDTEHGLVLGVTAFDMPDQTTEIMIRGKPFKIDPVARKLPRTLFLYELFKVEKGQILMIDAYLMNFEYGTSMGWGDR